MQDVSSYVEITAGKTNRDLECYKQAISSHAPVPSTDKTSGQMTGTTSCFIVFLIGTLGNFEEPFKIKPRPQPEVPPS